MNFRRSQDSGGNELVDLPNHPDKSARQRADLKAETGYYSWFDYLGAFQEDYPYAKLVMDGFSEGWRYMDHSHQTCALFNLQIGPSSNPNLDLQSSSASADTILSALRQPSPTAGIRIMLWDAYALKKEMLDLLGPRLKVHPECFRFLLLRCALRGALRGDPEYAFPWRDLIDGFDERDIAPEVVLLGQYLVTTARHPLSSNLDAPPAIMIFRLDGPSQPKAGKMANNNLNNNLNRVSSSRELAPLAVSNSVETLPQWMQEYVRLLKLDLQLKRERTSGITDLSVSSLTPLLQFYIFLFCEECDFIRTEYLHFTLPQNEFRYKTAFMRSSLRRRGIGNIKPLAELYELRYALRRMVEHSEDLHIFKQVRRFTHSQMPCDTPQDEPYIEIEDQLQQAHFEARRLETEIRDFLQLQTGELALQESRKSIELSSSQIEEAKRG